MTPRTGHTSSGLAGDLKQLWLLTWKNYSLQKRAIIGTFFEIFIPALFVIILLPIRTIVKSQQFTNDTIYAPFQVEKLPFLLPNDWYVAYQPNSSDLINQAMSKVAIKLGVRTRGFNSEGEMVSFLIDPSLYNVSLAGASFLSTNESNINYKLRFSYSPRNSGQFGNFRTDRDWKTNFIYSLFPILGPREKSKSDGGDPGYNREGFLAVQWAIDQALISLISKNNLVEQTSLFLKRFPFPPYNNDNFVAVITAIFPFIILISFVITVILTAKAIVHEKETGLKEAMRLMGMKLWVYWLSWYIKTFVLLLPALIFMIVSYNIKMNLQDGGKAAILNNTDPFLFTVFLFLYVSSTITLTFLSTTFFKKANSAAAGTGIIFFLTYLPYIFIGLRYAEMSMIEKIMPLFLSNLAMSMGIQLIGMFEGKGTGANFSNWTEGISVDDQFSLIIVMSFLFMHNFMHLGLMAYFERVMPGNYGIARPWHFPITDLIKWFKKDQAPHSMYVNNGRVQDSSQIENQTSSFGGLPAYFEDEGVYSNRKVGVKINNISKTFKQLGLVKKAVNNLSLNIYDGQITVLLGHNGAGKSTTISMITGLIEPDRGNILINGKDMVTETKEACSFIGLCPQHNLLFDDLTVYEHLRFFAKLKQNYNEAEIDSILELINLKDKKFALSKTLSGGMKRKLSIAIAFIGNSSIVILDEPTSGMDPQARHSTWSLLQKFKNEKNVTILLTTHFMDEADVLGDRIAIMSRGQLKCSGSPLFLKSKYGSGYNLVLTKQKAADSRAPATDMSDQIIELVRRFVPNAKLHSNINSEISFMLPIENTDKFPGLFEELEYKKEKLDVLNIGISITTLEDVFLKIGEHEHIAISDETASVEKSQNHNKQDQSFSLNPINLCNSGSKEDLINDKNASTSVPINDESIDEGLWTGSRPQDLNSGINLLLQQYYALTVKRFIHSARNKVLIVSQLIIPVAILCINLIYLKYGPIRVEDSPSLKITLSSYSKNYVPFYLGSPADQSLLDLSQYYIQSIQQNANSEPFDLRKTASNQTVAINYCLDKHDTIDNFLSCVGRTSYNYLIDNYITAAYFENQTNNVFNLTTYFNNQPYHVPPLAINQISNSLLNFYTKSKDLKTITVTNHPLPRNLNDQLNDAISKDQTGFNVASGLSFGFSFLIASFAVFLIKEKSSNSKHLQYLSGCNSYIFWISALVWDLFNYFITIVFAMILILAFDIQEFTSGSNWAYTFLILFLYGFAHIPQMYLLSHLFKVSATGFAALVGLNIITSQGALIPVNVLSIPALDLVDVSKILEWVFLVIFPNFAFSQGMIDLYNNAQAIKFCNQEISFLGFNSTIVKLCPLFQNQCCVDVGTDPNRCGTFAGGCLDWSPDYVRWAKPGLLRFFVFMTLQFVVQFGLVLLYEAGYLRWIKYQIYSLFGNEASKSKKKSGAEFEAQLRMEQEYGDIRKDENVIQEEKRIKELISKGLYKQNNAPEVFIVNQLTKYYNSFMAVKGVSFSMTANETFGLLGVNGAGKTTTFKMITGDELITFGDAYLAKTSLKNDIKQFQKKVGYCPQFDPLIDQMTVMETMEMFARLRGIRKQLIRRTCLSLIRLLDLDDHVGKMCFTLSGGNKRKLSVAISLIGSPLVVLLDEPTSGMDPKTRRTLWNCLNTIRNKGKSLILTTHSMDETEALCTNIGIMVNGEFKCLGSLQNLKSRYGEGYTLLCKLSLADLDENQKNARINGFISFILEKLNRSIIKESRDGFLNIHIKDNSINILSTVFALVENIKTKYSIEYYVVTQTNLEQIFLNFASKQIDPESRILPNKSCLRC